MRMRDRLLQEDFVDTPNGPWKVLVTCTCLNLTTWIQAESALLELFSRWPSPFDFIGKMAWYSGDLEQLLRPLGMVHRRTEVLRRMTLEFVREHLKHGEDYEKYDVGSMYGCGQYAVDAWTLFVLKRPCHPNDARLVDYARREGLYE